MTKRYYLFLLLLLYSAFSFAQKEFLKAGPMLGYSEMREVMIWVQTKEPVVVKIAYQNAEDERLKFETNNIFWS